MKETFLPCIMQSLYKEARLDGWMVSLTQYIIMILVKSSITVITGQESGVWCRIPEWKWSSSCSSPCSSSSIGHCVGPGHENIPSVEHFAV